MKNVSVEYSGYNNRDSTLKDISRRENTIPTNLRKNDSSEVKDTIDVVDISNARKSSSDDYYSNYHTLNLQATRTGYNSSNVLHSESERPLREVLEYVAVQYHPPIWQQALDYVIHSKELKINLFAQEIKDIVRQVDDCSYNFVLKAIERFTPKIVDSEVPDSEKILLVQAIRYSLKKIRAEIISAELELTKKVVSKLVNILSNNDSKISYEVAKCLEEILKKVENNNELLIKNLDPDINRTRNYLAADQVALNCVNQQLNRLENTSNKDLIFQACYNNRNIPTNYSKKKVQSAITSNSQATTFQSSIYRIPEDLRLEFDLSNTLFQTSANKRRTFTTEALPNIKTIKGDELAWYRTQYDEVKRILNDAKIKVVKTGDVKFITDLLLNDKCIFTIKNRTRYDRGMDEDIVKIFELVSKKGQILPKESMKKLFNILNSNRKDQFSKELRVNAFVVVENYLLRNRTDKEALDVVTNLMNNDIQLKDLAIALLNKIDSKDVDYKKLFNANLAQIKNKYNTDSKACYYLLQQSKDETRCKELFDKKVLQKLVKFIVTPEYSTPSRIEIGDAINNCISHLSEIASTLLNDMEIVRSYESVFRNESNKDELIEKCLNNIYLISKKYSPITNSGSQPVNELVPTNALILTNVLGGSIEKYTEDNANLTIVVLHTISQIVPVATEILNQIAYKLLEYRRVVQSQEIVFEINSAENSNNPTISSLTARIFHSSIVSYAKTQKLNLLKLSEPSLDFMLNVLKSNVDKNTRALVAESLNQLLEYQTVSVCFLEELSDYTDDDLPHVAVYSTVSLIHGVNRLSKYDKKVNSNLLNKSCELYVFNDLIIGDKDFIDEVNKTILNILRNEAKKGNKLSEENFIPLNRILLLNDIKSSLIICEIIENYTNNELIIPESTISVIENAVGKEDLYSTALNILKRASSNGQPISNRTIEIFSDRLLSSDKDFERKEAFELLQHANKNQDLPDHIFTILKAEMAGKIISGEIQNPEDIKLDIIGWKPSSELSDGFGVGEALSFLEKYSRLGGKLSINNFSTINKLIKVSILTLSNEFNKDHLSKCLSVLSHVSANRQFILNDIISNLSRHFAHPNDQKSSKDQEMLIQIFANVMKNGQPLPQALNLELEKALSNEQLCNRILPIFLYKAQKGEQINGEAINKILTEFCKDIGNTRLIDPTTIMTILSSSKEFNVNLALRSLSIIISNTNEDEKLVFKAIECFKELEQSVDLSNHDLSKTLVEGIVNKAILSESKLKEKILSIKLLSSDYISFELKAKISLVKLNLSESSNKEVLDSIAKITQKKQPILSSTFAQIKSIINESPILKQKALDILLTVENIQDISADLVEEVVNLLVIEEVSQKCSELLIKIAKLGKLYDRKALYLFSNQLIESKQKDHLQSLQRILNEISKNQKFDKQLKFLKGIDLDFISSKNLHYINIRLEEFGTALEKNYQLPEYIIEKLIESEFIEYCIANTPRNLANIFFYLLCQNRIQPTIEIAKIFDNSIDLLMLSTAVLIGYKNTIKVQNSTNVFDTVRLLINCEKHLIFFDLGKYQELLLQVFLEAVTLHSNTFLEDKDLVLYLEEKLKSSIPSVRQLSFSILRTFKKDLSKSDLLKKCYESGLDQFEQPKNMKTQDTKLNLLDDFLSLEYIDFNVLQNFKPNEWKIRFLITNLLAKFNLDEKDEIKFDHVWSAFEEKYYDNASCTKEKLLKLLTLNKDKHDYDFNLLIDILSLSELGYDGILQSIPQDASNPFINVKVKWLEMMVKSIISSNLSGLDKQVFEKDISYLIDMMSDSSFFEANVLRNFIQSFDTTKMVDISSFSTLINFIDINKIKLSDFHHNEISSLTIQDWQRKVELKTLSSKFLEVYREEVHISLNHLLDKGWGFEQLSFFSTMLKPSDHEESKEMNHILRMLDQYDVLKGHHTKLIKLLETETIRKEPKKWVTEVNKLIVANTFKVIGKIKNISTLIKELTSSNTENESIKNLSANLEKQVQKIKNRQLKSKFLSKPIFEWDREDIGEWSKHVKNEKLSKQIFLTKPRLLVETLAIIKRANYLHTGFELNDAQILSALVMINAPEKRLSQIATGEGKSTIISILAIVHCLMGKKVDVITSSPVLAERDAQEKAKLYKMFNLSVSDNSDKATYSRGKKSCYEKDIVYGDVGQFQFDTLRDGYSCLDTLAGRKKQVALIDEVDSMLLDDSSKIARLSSNMPGMECLEPIYHLLWQEVSTLSSKIVQIQNKTYLVYETSNIEYVKNHAKQRQISDEVGQEIAGDLDDFLRKHLENYTRATISDETIPNYNSCKKITIPKHLQEFSNRQIPSWVNNALFACYEFQEKIHYIVEDTIDGKCITPVDYDSTGIIQTSTNWGDGLHQFLQVKHGLKVTPETLTTNFLSNTSFFNDYPNIYGLTGTLGSESAKQLMTKVYKTDVVNIPPLLEKQHVRLPNLIADTEGSWIELVINSVSEEIQKDRGVLIICETIDQAETISNVLKKQHRAGAIKLYTMNNNNQEKDIESIDPGEVIVATNLAGRGTDIKTNSVIEQNGGLHVCLTFLPLNLRVEEQAFGRTSRQGKCGSSQMILNRQTLPFKVSDMKELDKQRAEFEATRLEELENGELPKNEIRDELFKKFCILLNTARERVKTEEQENISLSSKITTNIKKAFINTAPSIYEHNMIAALEERWGLLLKNIDQETITDYDKIREKYQIFESEILKDLKNNNLVRNPYYHSCVGYFFLQDSNYVKAKEHFKKAINLDKNSAASSYYGKAWATIGQKSLNYKELAIESFNKAKKLLQEELGVIGALGYGVVVDSELSKQLAQKEKIIGVYLGNIDTAIAVIKKSQRLITIETKEGLETQTYSELIRDPETLKVQTLEKINSMNDISVTFNNLTIHSDCGERDQAKETVESALKELNSNYKRIKINYQSISASEVATIFDEDVRLINVSRDEALHELDSKNSFLRRHLSLPKCLDSYEVNLSIIGDKFEKSQSKIQIKEAIKLVKKQENTARFNINFLRINKNFVNSNSKSPQSLSITFPLISKQVALEKIGIFTDSRKKFMNLKMQICKNTEEDLLQAISAFEGEHIVFNYDTEQKQATQKSLVKDKAKQEILKGRFDTVELILSNPEEAKKIINSTSNSIFSIEFISVTKEKILQGVENYAAPINLNFSQLDKEQANQLINHARKENLEFGLTFESLNLKTAEGVVRQASMAQEDIEVTEIKSLKELFAKDEIHFDELRQLTARGMEQVIKLHEKGALQWRSIIAVGALAAIQIAVGATLVATGVGATIGLGLITEGVVDVYTAYRIYSKRDFTWSTYAAQKAISIAISAATAGIQAIKEAARAAKVSQELVTQATIEVGEQTVQNIGIKGAHSAKSIIKDAGKLLLNTKVSTSVVAKSLALKGINTGLNIGAQKSLEYFYPKIRELVSERIKTEFYSHENLLRIIHKILALKDYIKNIDADIIKIINKIFDYNKQIASVIFTISNIVGKIINSSLENALTIVVKIGTILNNLSEVTTIIETIHSELLKVDKRSFTTSQLIIDFCRHSGFGRRITKENAKRISRLLEEQEIIEKTGYFFQPYGPNYSKTAQTFYLTDLKNSNSKPKISDIKLKEMDEHKELILNSFLMPFHQKVSREESEESLNNIVEIISEDITKQVMKSLESFANQAINVVNGFASEVINTSNMSATDEIGVNIITTSLKTHSTLNQYNNLVSPVAAKIAYYEPTEKFDICYETPKLEILSNNGSLLLENVKRAHKHVDNLLNNVSDEEVIIFIGTTGSGKSTLINYLAGVALEAEEVNGNIRVSTKNQLRDIKIGHGGSETRIPNRWKDDASGIVYWDCPGFGDTAGTEQEIINALYIKQLFKRSAKKFKVVMTIRDADICDSRAVKLKAIIENLNQLFKNTLDIKCVSVVVTKCDNHKTIQNIEGLIKDLLGPERSDVSEIQKVFLQSIVDGKRISLFRKPISEGSFEIISKKEIEVSLRNSSYSEIEDANITISDEARKEFNEEIMQNLYINNHKILSNVKNCLSEIIEKLDIQQLENLNKELEVIDSNDELGWAFQAVDVMIKKGLMLFSSSLSTQNIKLNKDIEYLKDSQKYFKFAAEINCEVYKFLKDFTYELSVLRSKIRTQSLIKKYKSKVEITNDDKKEKINTKSNKTLLKIDAGGQLIGGLINCIVNFPSEVRT